MPGFAGSSILSAHYIVSTQRMIVNEPSTIELVITTTVYTIIAVTIELR